MSYQTWDKRFINLAQHISEWSKDPSTKCGAVIVRPDQTIVSTGYNGFPRNILDDPQILTDREEKYKRIIHAEMNAVLFAKESLRDCTLYLWPFLSCERCTVCIIQSGISRVVYPTIPNDKLERWLESLRLSRELYREAGVTLHEAFDT